MLKNSARSYLLKKERLLNRLSRRQFLKRCFYYLLLGLGAPVLNLFNNSKTHAAPSQDFVPSYLELYKQGELLKRGKKLWEGMAMCTLCPRRCRANRLSGEEGFCQASSQLEVSAAYPHFGEEKPLVGKKGSGTIFFTNCSLRCVFCINWRISHEGQGRKRSIDDLADMMLDLQSKGCHNINFVTPTHYLPHIILALNKAAAKGLRLPLVYNSSGWERVEILKALNGIVDIYLPDFKYSSSDMSKKYSAGAIDYPDAAGNALLEMHRQVGVALPSEDGIIRRGLMIRHLVMPNGTSGTKGVIDWIAAHLPKSTYVNIMSQYQPFYKAFNYPELSRRITDEEYEDAVAYARKVGLRNTHLQKVNYKMYPIINKYA